VSITDDLLVAEGGEEGERVGGVPGQRGAVDLGELAEGVDGQRAGSGAGFGAGGDGREAAERIPAVAAVPAGPDVAGAAAGGVVLEAVLAVEAGAGA
jgi:hypothetical protein